jgi:hypothetical protein
MLQGFGQVVMENFKAKATCRLLYTYVQVLIRLRSLVPEKRICRMDKELGKCMLIELSPHLGVFKLHISKGK